MNTQRVSIFVDGANIFFTQKNKLHWWIDLKKLLDWARTKGELVDAYYYIGVEETPDSKQEQFLKALPKIGYSLVTKPLKTIWDSNNNTEKQKANLDIEIVLDMFNTIDNYDLAILVSGDGDFERVIDLLKHKGKRFLVLSTEGFIANELRNRAGMHYVDLMEIRPQIEKTIP